MGPEIRESRFTGDWDPEMGGACGHLASSA